MITLNQRRLGGTATNAGFDSVTASLFVPESSSFQLLNFTYDPGDGTEQVSIKGAARSSYKLVEADDLDFTNPDQTPIPLTVATVGTLATPENEVIADGNGNATVQYNLGSAKDATFLRAQTVP